MNDLTAPQPNIPLLRKAVEWAEAEAAKTDGTCMWNQRLWAEQTDCGTAYCVAGYTVAVAHPTAQIAYEPCDCSPGCCAGEMVLRIDGKAAPFAVTAETLLGITSREGLALFEGQNTVADVRRIAEQIAARAGERL